MQAAKRYMSDTITGMEKAAFVMNPSSKQTGHAPLPATHHEIRRYVHDLLTADEQAACDMATD